MCGNRGSLTWVADIVSDRCNEPSKDINRTEHIFVHHARHQLEVELHDIHRVKEIVVPVTPE